MEQIDPAEPVPLALYLKTLPARREMALNEARILGHAEARSKGKLTVARELVAAGLLVRAGRDSAGRDWFKLPPRAPLDISGPKVRIRAGVGRLGASWAGDLTRNVQNEDRTAGDEGVVVFEHPNPKACPGWVYLKCESLTIGGGSVYVGVHPEMIEWA